MIDNDHRWQERYRTCLFLDRNRQTAAEQQQWLGETQKRKEKGVSIS
ncbi:hypothetical protein K6W16_15925 [Burkholderia dolosa]|uniref:Uncharacterized protein n=1 Tax=Burkholderia dolosa TaxID=152500 RepID=A0A892I0V5_9BURK|nr:MULTISPECIES: hypothetical protein [Burkholderia]MBR8420313.1 hypothetical protein [Burkholderia dolosa]MBY4658729.1 hypothetical protein [Burkholderia dolosa]MBY4689484.1 hypothetical protein [Burkholderia dolosa]MBY4780729.1 hypothetical protein [Burkholderia dolosa]MBY4787411.1 hypothetical protein [Burkholderia dolosa]